jgi:hypothetical protein
MIDLLVVAIRRRTRALRLRAGDDGTTVPKNGGGGGGGRMMMMRLEG